MVVCRANQIADKKSPDHLWGGCDQGLGSAVVLGEKITDVLLRFTLYCLLLKFIGGNLELKTFFQLLFHLSF
jgi:hypothetical protein